MNERPLSPTEESLIEDFVEAARRAVSSLPEAEGSEPPSGWWSLPPGDEDTITVTEVASDWGGVGREVPLVTFGPPDRHLLYAHMSIVPGGKASSLLFLNLTRGLMAVRFKPFQKKRPIRFLVGEPGCRAAAWRLWAGTNTDDIYLGDRQTVRYAKISLHASGDWRFQWTSDDRDEVRVRPRKGVPPPEGRVIRRWTEPPTAPGGWTHVMSIFTTRRDVVDIPGDHQQRDETMLIPAPDAGWVVEFAVFLITPDGALMDIANVLRPNGATAKLLGGYLLPSGRTVVVWAITHPLSPQMERRLRAERHKARERNKETDWSLDPGTGPRLQIVRLPDASGALQLWDLAQAPPHRPKGLDAFMRGPLTD